MNTADAVQAFLYNRRSLNRRPTTLKWYERRFDRFTAFSRELLAPTHDEVHRVARLMVKYSRDNHNHSGKQKVEAKRLL